MDERSTQDIMLYLQKEDVQARVLQNIQKGRNEAAVTISRAAELFGFTENKLRDWEEVGFLTPLRPGGLKGRRLYPLDELDKLAIIRELIDAGYARGDIPPNINELWRQAYTMRKQTIPLQALPPQIISPLDPLSDLPIDLRLEKARDEIFWRYYAYQALRLSLMLICEEMPDPGAGLILPLCGRIAPGTIETMDDLPKISEAFVYWLEKNGSSYLFHTFSLAFQIPSDYRLLPLTAMTEDQVDEEPEDATLILLDRRAWRLTLSAEVVKTIRSLLQPLYTEKVSLEGVLHSQIQMTEDEDIVLNGLADMIVRLGGLVGDLPRWRYCYILVPQNAHLPLHQNVLVVRMRNSKQPLHRSGSTTIPSDEYRASIEALQSSHIVYIRKTLGPDSAIAYRREEELDEEAKQEAFGSIVAIPLRGEDGLAIAVLCIKASRINAFAEEDMRLLRILCKMIEEVMRVSRIRQDISEGLVEVIEKPERIDNLFKDFLSRSDFFDDVEHLLSGISASFQENQLLEEQTVAEVDKGFRAEEKSANVVSFIAIDVDKQSSKANIYGELVAKNLCREVGARILELIPAVAREQKDCRVYHVYGDRFYILLKDVPLQRACKIAEQLRQGLTGTYTLDALRTSLNQPVRPESMLELTDITVRLGVTSYPFAKLKEMLDSQAEDAVVAVRSILAATLATYLDKGRNAGGNVIFAWDETLRQIVRWSPLS